MNENLSEMLERAREYDRQLPELRLPDGHPGEAPVASFIDHTLLKPEATPQQIETLCEEARQNGFASVCINPVYVPLAHRLLAGSPVMTCTVIGFPLGATMTAAKIEETRAAIEAGAQEVDMVIPVGLLKGGEYAIVLEDIRSVVETAHGLAAAVKVIIETALLTQSEKITACLLAQAAGADFVKTSTGFSTSGATVQDVELMRRVVGPQMGVKAAGGVRSLSDARAMLQAGATRLGSSSGVKIAQEAQGGASQNSPQEGAY